MSFNPDFSKFRGFAQPNPSAKPFQPFENKFNSATLQNTSATPLQPFESKFKQSMQPSSSAKPFQPYEKIQFTGGFTQKPQSKGFNDNLKTKSQTPFEFARPAQQNFPKAQNEPKAFNPRFQNPNRPPNPNPTPSRSFDWQKKPEKNPQIEMIREDFQEDWNEVEAKLKEKALQTFRQKKSQKSVPEPISQTLRVRPKDPVQAASSFNIKKNSFQEPSVPKQTNIVKANEKPLKNNEKSIRPNENRPSFGNKVKETENNFPASKSKVVMCSIEECKSREESKQLSIFERVPGTNEFKLDWTVKKYLRSSADREEYIRTAFDLSGTLSYLINHILDVDKNGNPNEYDYQVDSDSHTFQDIYTFLFDRMRAIVKDWKMLKVNESDDYIKDHERIARFLIMSCVEGLSNSDFNLNLNLKLTEDVLNCLVRTYEKRRSKKLPCKSQAEFISYFIITKPDNMLQILTMLRGLPKEVVESRYVQLALCLLGNYHNEDFEEFFNTVYDSPFLLACAAYPLFHKIRPLILVQLEESSNREASLELFQQLLGFGDEAEARAFIEDFDLGLIDDPNPSKAIVKISQIPDRKSQIFSLVPSQIIEKCTFETRLETISMPEEFEPDEVYEDTPTKTPPPPSITQPIKVSPKPYLPTPEPLTNTLFQPSEVQIKPTPSPASNPTLLFQHPPQPLAPAPIPTPPAPQLLSLTPPSPMPPTQFEPSKTPKKKMMFRFPFEDKDIFSIITDKKQKIRIKENIRTFRTEKKLMEKSKNRQQESLMKLRIFKAWKGFTTQNRLEVYLEKRKQREIEVFRQQFSSLVISDLVCQQRFLYLNEVQVPQPGRFI